MSVHWKNGAWVSSPERSDMPLHTSGVAENDGTMKLHAGTADSFLNGVLDGKRIAYHKNTVFLVQVGKGPKGSYKTSYKFTGNLAKAVMYYNAINIGNGYKKRLLMPSSSRNPVLGKQMKFSFMPKTVRQAKSTILAKAQS